MCFNMTLHAKLLGNHLFFTNRDSRKTNSVCGKPPPCFRFRKRRVWIVIRCRVSLVCISSSGLVLSHIDWKIVPFDPPPLHIVWNMWDVNTNYPNNLFFQCLRISSMFIFGTFYGLSFEINIGVIIWGFPRHPMKQTISLRAVAGRCIICTSNHLGLQTGADPWREDSCKWPILNLWYCTL